LPGANIQLDKSAKATVSDVDGNFMLRDIAAGEYQIRVTYVGFKSYSQSITIPGESQLNIALEEAVEVTEELLVTATRASENTPTTYSNISDEELERLNLGQDLPFLLNQTPSVVVTSDA